MSRSKTKKEKEEKEHEQPVKVQPEESQTESLQRRCDQLAAERDELVAKHQRALADLQNYQKRVARERPEEIRRTKVDTIEQALFPAIDDLDRAIQAANDHGYNADDPLLAGLTMVHTRMFELLKQYGIEPIDAAGRPFDPLYHQAMMEQPSDTHAEGTVMHVVSRGYTENGKTIRPARVVVAKEVEKEAEPDDKQEQEPTDADL